jgi:hypothetical protein
MHTADTELLRSSWALLLAGFKNSGSIARLTYCWIWISYYRYPGNLTDEKDKVIPVTGCGGPYGCEILRLPHFLDSRLTDGSELSAVTPKEDSWYSFCWRLSQPQDHSAAGRFRSIEKFNDIGNQTRDLPVFSIVPQPCVPKDETKKINIRDTCTHPNVANWTTEYTSVHEAVS